MERAGVSPPHRPSAPSARATTRPQSNVVVATPWHACEDLVCKYYAPPRTPPPQRHPAGPRRS
eukprot:3208058-Prymnesium_polylepis.1